MKSFQKLFMKRIIMNSVESINESIKVYKREYKSVKSINDLNK